MAARKVEDFVGSMVGEDLHAKRVLSLSNATLGVIHGASLGVATIGRALAQARGLETKHAIKQVDRLMSNSGIDVWSLFETWVPSVVGSRPEVVVAMDWTEFDADGQSTIALHLLTKHGRATPLVWKTVQKSELKGERNRHEDDVLERLREVLPETVKVTILADRGFGDVKLYELLGRLGFNFVIRFRGNIQVQADSGETKTAAEWVLPSGRARLLRHARVTQANFRVPSLVFVRAPRMKEAWFLAASDETASASDLVKLYGRRFTIEESFRDIKDLRFGFGLSACRIGDIARRDRLLFVGAMAVVLLTLLGSAAEDTGLDRTLKANTVKTRTHSLLNQGLFFYGALPNMKPHRFEPLMRRFGEILAEQPFFRLVYGQI